MRSFSRKRRFRPRTTSRRRSRFVKRSRLISRTRRRFTRRTIGLKRSYRRTRRSSSRRIKVRRATVSKPSYYSNSGKPTKFNKSFARKITLSTKPSVQCSYHRVFIQQTDPNFSTYFIPHLRPGNPWVIHHAIANNPSHFPGSLATELTEDLESQLFILANQICRYTIMNQTNGDCHLRIYECVARAPDESNGSYLGDINEVALFPATNKILQDGFNATEFPIKVNTLFDNTGFCQKFKILKTTAMNIKPGVEAKFYLTQRQTRTFKMQDLFEPFGPVSYIPSSPMSYTKGSKFLVYQAWGQLASSTIGSVGLEPVKLVCSQEIEFDLNLNRDLSPYRYLSYAVSGQFNEEYPMKHINEQTQAIDLATQV